MTANTTGPWTPPDPAHLTFSNCTIAAEWVRSFLNAKDIPIFSTLAMIGDANSGKIPQTAEDLTANLEWMTIQMTGENSVILQEMWNFARGTCIKSICPLIGWQGYSDIAGRGMYVNYIVQAALASAYICVLIIIRLDHIPTKLNSGTMTSRLMAATLHSTRIFLDTALLFCVAMLIAAISTFGRALINADTPLPTYYSLATAFMSLYSVIPALLLDACASNNLRRTLWRRLVWAFIAILSLVVVVLYFVSPYMPQLYDSSNFDLSTMKDPENQLTWDLICLNRKAAKNFTIVVRVLIGCLLGTTLVYLVFSFVSLHVKYLPLQTLRRYWWLVTAVVSTIAMWTCLGFFTAFRLEMEEGTGVTNKDRDWTFGQVMGLVAWAPVLVEFLTIWKQGAKEALTGQLMMPYRVVSFNTEDEKGAKEIEKLESKQLPRRPTTS